MSKKLAPLALDADPRNRDWLRTLARDNHALAERNRRAKLLFNPNHVPAGAPNGGQFTSGGGGGGGGGAGAKSSHDTLRALTAAHDAHVAAAKALGALRGGGGSAGEIAKAEEARNHAKDAHERAFQAHEAAHIEELRAHAKALEPAAVAAQAEHAQLKQELEAARADVRDASLKLDNAFQEAYKRGEINPKGPEIRDASAKYDAAKDNVERIADKIGTLKDTMDTYQEAIDAVSSGQRLLIATHKAQLGQAARAESNAMREAQQGQSGQQATQNGWQMANPVTAQTGGYYNETLAIGDAPPFDPASFHDALATGRTNQNAGVNPSKIVTINGEEYLAKKQGDLTRQDEIRNSLSESAAVAVAHAAGLGGVTIPTYTVADHGDVYTVVKWEQGMRQYSSTQGERLAQQGTSQLDAQKLFLHEYLTADSDRHGGNYLVDANGKVYQIDHAYSFGTRVEPDHWGTPATELWDHVAGVAGHVQPNNVHAPLRTFDRWMVESVIARQPEVLAAMRRYGFDDPTSTGGIGKRFDALRKMLANTSGDPTYTDLQQAARSLGANP